jgi:hypothetical protein
VPSGGTWPEFGEFGPAFAVYATTTPICGGWGGEAEQEQGRHQDCSHAFSSNSPKPNLAIIRGGAVPLFGRRLTA